MIFNFHADSEEIWEVLLSTGGSSVTTSYATNVVSYEFLNNTA
jgi:hypothetical protein